MQAKLVSTRASHDVRGDSLWQMALTRIEETCWPEGAMRRICSRGEPGADEAQGEINLLRERPVRMVPNPRPGVADVVGDGATSPRRSRKVMLILGRGMARV